MNEFALVIEDDADQALIFAEALRAAGFEPEVVRDGRAALTRLEARLEATAPSLVVLDLHIPHVLGKDLLYYIRTDERLAGTHVILASGDYQLSQSLRDQADVVLLKPIGFQQLRDMASRMRLLDEAD
jgi:DNA-binding response OmpR family regulator